MAARVHLELLVMSSRIRHCVECPRCHTYYLIASSPYSNGAYIVPTGAGSEEYTLYCFCEDKQLPHIGKWQLAIACDVSKAAHRQGYGTLHEVWPITRRAPHSRWSHRSLVQNP